MTSSKKNVSIAVINYNGESVLEKTFDSIFKLDYPDIKEIFLVDNCSTDNSVDLVRKKYPHVKIKVMDDNKGPNIPRNWAIEQAQSELVLIMDNDIILSPDAVALLANALHQNPQAGVTGPQIRYYDNPKEIQYNGCYIHYVGGAISNPYTSDTPKAVGALSAGAMLLNRNKTIEIGMFDEDFIFGWEDGDFSFRMTIAGYPCLIVPQAHVFHNSHKKGIRWLTYQVRNRWWFILKNYNLRTIIVISPTVLLYQLAIMGFFTLKGQLSDYLKGTWAVISGMSMLIRQHKEVMRFKKVNDRTVLMGGKIDMLGDVNMSLPVKIVTNLFNFIFSSYWALTKRLL